MDTNKKEKNLSNSIQKRYVKGLDLSCELKKELCKVSGFFYKGHVFNFIISKMIQDKDIFLVKEKTYKVAILNGEFDFIYKISDGRYSRKINKILGEYIELRLSSSCK